MAISIPDIILAIILTILLVIDIIMNIKLYKTGKLFNPAYSTMDYLQGIVGLMLIIAIASKSISHQPFEISDIPIGISSIIFVAIAIARTVHTAKHQNDAELPVDKMK